MCVTKCDDGNIRVRSLFDGFEVGIRVYNNKELGLFELFGLVVGERARSPL